MVIRLLSQTINASRASALSIAMVCLGAMLLCLCVACGGGGTQGAPVGPARASIHVSPSVIDSGDRTEVVIDISELEIDTLAIKVSFPTALEYVVESAMWEVDGEFFDAGPDETATTSSSNILVFYFDPASFAEEYDIEFEGDRFTLVFELLGVGSVQNGTVGVDIDLDDPEIDNRTEFDSSDPRFDAQDEDDIRVGDFTNSGSSSSSSSSSGG